MSDEQHADDIAALEQSILFLQRSVNVCHEQIRGLTEAKRQAEERAEKAERERDAWIETARMHNGNEEFYRGLVTKIGEPFGPPAYTSDDGSIQQDVLALKVPELVDALHARARQAEAQAEGMKKIVDCAQAFIDSSPTSDRDEPYLSDINGFEFEALCKALAEHFNKGEK